MKSIAQKINTLLLLVLMGTEGYLTIYKEQNAILSKLWATQEMLGFHNTFSSSFYKPSILWYRTKGWKTALGKQREKIKLLYNIITMWGADIIFYCARYLKAKTDGGECTVQDEWTEALLISKADHSLERVTY